MNERSIAIEFEGDHLCRITKLDTGVSATLLNADFGVENLRDMGLPPHRRPLPSVPLVCRVRVASGPMRSVRIAPRMAFRRGRTVLLWAHRRPIGRRRRWTTA